MHKHEMQAVPLGNWHSQPWSGQWILQNQFLSTYPPNITGGPDPQIEKHGARDFTVRNAGHFKIYAGQKVEM